MSLSPCLPRRRAVTTAVSAFLLQRGNRLWTKTPAPARLPRVPGQGWERGASGGLWTRGEPEGFGWEEAFINNVFVFPPPLLPSLAVPSPRPSPPLCGHTRAEELERRREGPVPGARRAGVLCLGQSGTPRRRPGKPLSHLPGPPPRRKADGCQLSADVGWCFCFSLGTSCFPPPPRLTSEISFFPVSGPVPFPPRSPHSPSLFMCTRGLGEGAAGVRSGPRAGVSGRRCCPPGAGCWASGVGNVGLLEVW